VGSANDPVTEVIRDGLNGRLVPFAAPERLAEVVLDLLSDPSQRARLGEQGRQTVLQRYRIEQSLQSYEQLITSLKLTATRG
jgi:glycosyltransferase involved in cell wall biosynthesis